VGTLAHPPNRVALQRLLPLLEDFPEEFQVELVGGPTAMGEEFQSRFRRVRYRGRLPEEELGGVAGRWALFLNPLFWLSRGASMKLGRALGWGLAVVTTDSGRRGYKIPDDSVVLCRDDEHAFAEAILRVGRDLEQCRRVRAALMSSAPGFPTAVSVGAELRQWLA